MKTAMQDVKTLIDSPTMDDEQIFGVIKNLINILIDKERSQIIDAYISGDLYSSSEDAMLYYNETFK